MKRIVCGPRAVVEALRSAASEVHLVLHSADSKAIGEVLEEAKRRKVQTQQASAHQLDRLAGQLRHQGVIAVTGEFPYLDLDELLRRAADDRAPLLLALDQVQDVHNVGALMRSAVALGAAGLLLCRHEAARVSPAAVRVSAGASEHASVARVTNLSRSLARLAEEGYAVIGLAAEAERPLDELDLRGPVAFVLGSEGRGLRRLVAESCSALASIPLPGPIASLNVSLAGTIALYEAARQRRK